MYFVTVTLLTVVLPVASILLDHAMSATAVSWFALIGKWFVFWSAGVRLILAGLRQFYQPGFTARDIFGLRSDDALPIVRELGIANFANRNRRSACSGKAELCPARGHFRSDILRTSLASATHWTLSGRSTKRSRWRPTCSCAWRSSRILASRHIRKRQGLAQRRLALASPLLGGSSNRSASRGPER